MIDVSWEINKCMERVTLKRLENGVGEWWILRAHKTRVRCTLHNEYETVVGIILRIIIIVLVYASSLLWVSINT